MKESTSSHPTSYRDPRGQTSQAAAPSWRPIGSSDSHEIPCIVWKPDVRWRVYKSSLPVLLLSQKIQSTTSDHIPSKSILILSFRLRLRLPSGFPIKTLYTFLFSPMCATYPARHIDLHSISLIMFDKGYKLLRCSLCKFFKPLVTSSSILSTFKIKFYTHTKQQAKS